MLKEILVIGESCKDVFCYGKCNRLAPEAPAPVFNPVRETSNPGMALNVKKNIESLGVPCAIHTNFNWESITKTRYVHIDTNQMFMRVDEHDDKVGKCKVRDIDFSAYKIVVVSDYNKGFLTKDDIQYISENHPCVFLDTKKKLGKWCENIKFIKINNKEYKRSIDFLPPNLEEKIIVTLGDKGCLYRGEVYSVNKVEIKDVSGAGDTFLAGLVTDFYKTNDIKKSIVFANECATQVVQRRGVNTL
jgi:D-beta-D-heptose 7-phosphate kinase/D-beta-D-heptose 1-phosphate adenosyltransferase